MAVAQDQNQASPSLDPKMLREKLTFIYDEETAAALLPRIEKLCADYAANISLKEGWVDENDAMLITYGDSLTDGEQAPAAVLHDFLNRHLKDELNAVHLLPFYPYSSDDGFSVIDYKDVNEKVGAWTDIENLSKDYDLMFDGVINHISQHSEWFQGYLKGDPKYQTWFWEGDPEEDYSTVTRPRTHFVLSPYETANGTKHVWTTFSDDQVDLNYEEPEVLMAILDVLLFYASKGARYVRFDAIGFMWKILGTSCIHLPETHALVQVMRHVMETAAPGAIIITETNVPHKENISYFGDGSNEAHMVYQFPLPPLTLYAFISGEATHLTSWAAGLEPTTEQTSFFNFLASHDGIGVRPTEGILSDADRQIMAERVQQNGGRVNFKANSDGSQSPYELNINYLDAVSLPDDTDEMRARKFMAAQTILLSMAGVPGIYIHSILGSRSDIEGMERKGYNRAINREQLERSKVEKELATEGHLRNLVLNKYKQLLTLRRKEAAFAPNAAQHVLQQDPRVFAVKRGEGEDMIIALINVSDQNVTLNLAKDIEGETLHDIINDETCKIENVAMPPYQMRWLKAA